MLLPRFPPLQSGAAFSSPAFSVAPHTHTDTQTQTDFIICPMLYAIAMGQIITQILNTLARRTDDVIKVIGSKVKVDFAYISVSP